MDGKIREYWLSLISVSWLNLSFRYHDGDLTIITVHSLYHILLVLQYSQPLYGYKKKSKRTTLITLFTLAFLIFTLSEARYIVIH